MKPFVCSIDFYDGDFELFVIHADNIKQANRFFTIKIKEWYGEHLEEIVHISVNDYRYVDMQLAKLG